MNNKRKMKKNKKIKKINKICSKIVKKKKIKCHIRANIMIFKKS
jgi:hypothetical protein